MARSNHNATHRQNAGLAHLSQALLASLGVASFECDVNLAPTDSLVIFMVDGLGQLLLDEHQSHAPFLRTLLSTNQPFRVGFPATTATSLASFALAQESGQHGIVGSRFALDIQTAFSPLPWQVRSPYSDQPSSPVCGEQPIFTNEKTAWQAASVLGLSIECILPSNIAGSPYSKAVYKGATITPYTDYSHCGAQIRATLNTSSPQLIYIYLGELDFAGHVHGPHSDAWLNSLKQIDALISSTASNLAQGTRLLVCADHGMTTLCPEVTFDFDTTPPLQEGVAWIAGDIRARHIYAQVGQSQAVSERWKSILGDDFTVLSRSQAVNEGLFGGTVRTSAEQRIGDLIVFPTGQGGIVQSHTEKNQTLWKGHHGALTEQDQLSPLLSYSNG